MENQFYEGGMSILNLNLTTMSMILFLAILIYFSIKFFDKIIFRLISISLGVCLSIFILNKIGITIPIISHMIGIVIDAFKDAFDIILGVLDKIKPWQFKIKDNIYYIIFYLFVLDIVFKCYNIFKYLN